MTADNEPRYRFTIHVARSGGECIAGIPELYIAEKGETAQEALSAALRAEEKALGYLENGGLPPPPAADLALPPHVLHRFAKKYFSFVAKIAIGYVVVLCLIAVSLAVALPSARARVEQYLLSKDASTDIKKAMSRLGIDSCSRDR